MKIELLNLLDDFRKKLTDYQYNQYIPKLRDYLFPYIESTFQESSITEIFQNEFTKKNIIDSAIYYIDINTNVQRISAIDDYLIALNSFFEKTIFEKYHNTNLMSLKPFIRLNKDVKEKIKEKNITLLEKETFPAINDFQSEYIFHYLNNCYSYRSLSSYQTSIILKLMLLYGFSHDILSNLKLNNYNSNKNTLLINNITDVRKNITLELPFNLKEDFIQYFNFRNLQTSINSEFLFVTEKNTKIKNGFLSDTLDKIRKKFTYDNADIDDNTRNPFTPTGLQKYAIIKLILSDFNQSILSDLTGQKQDILIDCQLSVNEKKVIKLNRYINHMIRGIDTYDKI